MKKHELDIEELVDFSYGERLAEFASTADPYRVCYCIVPENSSDLGSALEDTLIRILDAGGTEDDACRIMGAEIPSGDADDEEYIHLDRGYCICGQITYYHEYGGLDEYRSYIMEWCGKHGVHLEDLCTRMDADDSMGFYFRLQGLLESMTGSMPESYLDFCYRQAS